MFAARGSYHIFTDGVGAGFHGNELDLMQPFDLRYVAVFLSADHRSSFSNNFSLEQYLSSQNIAVCRSLRIFLYITLKPNSQPTIRASAMLNYKIVLKRKCTAQTKGMTTMRKVGRMDESITLM